MAREVQDSVVEEARERGNWEEAGEPVVRQRESGAGRRVGVDWEAGWAVGEGPETEAVGATEAEGAAVRRRVAKAVDREVEEERAGAEREGEPRAVGEMVPGETEPEGVVETVEEKAEEESEDLEATAVGAEVEYLEAAAERKAVAEASRVEARKEEVEEEKAEDERGGVLVEVETAEEVMEEEVAWVVASSGEAKEAESKEVGQEEVVVSVRGEAVDWVREKAAKREPAEKEVVVMAVVRGVEKVMMGQRAEVKKARERWNSKDTLHHEWNSPLHSA